MPSRPLQRNTKAQRRGSRSAAKPAPKPVQTHEIVDPRWVAKMLAVVVLAALLCAQLLVWWVFAKTQWQYVLKPSRAVPAHPSQLDAASKLSFDEVRFGVDATGQPQLDGWWIPAAQETTLAARSAATALLLHSGDGSMSDALPAASELHEAGLNVLLFDYRGYGHSGGRHPAEATMQADAESALSYLTSTRRLPSKQVVVFGVGVGASLAVTLCQDHPELPGLILLNAEGDLRERVSKDPRVRLVPISLLFHEDFALAKPLAQLATPKLLLSTGTSHAPTAFALARDPKMTVELPANDRAAMEGAIKRFLDDLR